MTEQLEAISAQIRDILTLRQQANNIGRLQKEIERTKRETSQLESNLMATGSTKTADDVQHELSQLTEQMWVGSVSWTPFFISLLSISRKNDRENRAVNIESERQSKLSRELENDLHRLYTSEYFQSLTSDELDDLNVQPSVALLFPARIMRLACFRVFYTLANLDDRVAARFRHIKYRGTAPLPRHDPSLNIYVEGQTYSAFIEWFYLLNIGWRRPRHGGLAMEVD